MSARERVGLFIVTVRSSERDDAAWIARIATTTDVDRYHARSFTGQGPTVKPSELLGALRAWLDDFESDTFGADASVTPP